MNLDYQEDYQAALHGCVFRLLQNTGPFLISGEDRTSFLQRQSTNDLTKLQSNGTLSTVLTNPSARIIDVLRVIKVADGETDCMLVLTTPGFYESTTAYLKSRIFFMDKVSLENRSEHFVHIELDGPQNAAVGKAVGLKHFPKENALTAFEIEGEAVYCFAHPGYAGSGCTMLAPSASADGLIEEFRLAGAIELNQDTTNTLRIESGLPGPGSELSTDYTPLETGLENLISEAKGCYTGQEVLARQITYNKVTQTLCGLRFQSPVEPGTRLWGGNKPAGSLTSYTHSPRVGHIGLGIIKRPHNQPGTSLRIGAPDANTATEVCALPFK